MHLRVCVIVCSSMGGYLFLDFVRFWLLRFLAFLGFLAPRILGFSDSCWFMRLLVIFLAFAFRILSSPAFGFLAFEAFRWFMQLLVACLALAFRILCFPSSSPAVFWLLHPFIGCWLWIRASSTSPVPLRQVLFVFMPMYVCRYVCNLCMYVRLYVCTSSNLRGLPPPHPPATV